MTRAQFNAAYRSVRRATAWCLEDPTAANHVAEANPEAFACLAATWDRDPLLDAQERREVLARPKLPF